MKINFIGGFFDTKDVCSPLTNNSPKKGAVGYFTNTFSELKLAVEADNTKILGTYYDYSDDDFIFEPENSNQQYRYFLEKKNVHFTEPEKKLRPFKTIEEFMTTLDMLYLTDSCYYIRTKQTGTIFFGIIEGFNINNNHDLCAVAFRAMVFTCRDLLDYYEWKSEDEKDSDVWHPFGVVTEEQENE